MAYIPRRLFRFDPADFERRIVKKHPGYCYLYYVGLGFWAGMRRCSPQRVEELIQGLDPLHSQLAYDGYGFQTAFFDAPRDEHALDRLRSFEGYAVNTAFQGVGRALWFRYLGDRRELHSRIAACGDYAADVAGGLGLATVFLNPDRLQVAQEVGRSLPTEWQAEFHLGMCFALKARSINDPVTFNKHLSQHDESVQQAALASLAACDRIEWETRNNHPAGGYRRWREEVRDWMARRIAFPLAGLKKTGTSAATATPVAASAWE